MDKRLRFLYTDPDNVFVKKECGLYLTNDGIWEDYKVRKVGSLYVTPERVERNVIHFKSFKDFFQYIKSIATSKESKSDFIGEHGTYVGYVLHTYKTKFEEFVYARGEWMDDYAYWSNGEVKCFIDNPNHWK